MSLLLSRARVLTAWGQSLLDAPRGGQDPEPRLHAAVADLDRADGHVAADDSEHRFMLDSIRYKAMTALGDVATRRSRLPEAREFYEKAKALLEPLSHHSPKTKNELLRRPILIRKDAPGRGE